MRGRDTGTARASARGGTRRDSARVGARASARVGTRDSTRDSQPTRQHTRRRTSQCTRQRTRQRKARFGLHCLQCTACPRGIRVARTEVVPADRLVCHLSRVEHGIAALPVVPFKFKQPLNANNVQAPVSGGNPIPLAHLHVRCVAPPWRVRIEKPTRSCKIHPKFTPR